jgi:hypothetical protein
VSRPRRRNTKKAHKLDSYSLVIGVLDDSLRPDRRGIESQTVIFRIEDVCFPKRELEEI